MTREPSKDSLSLPEIQFIIKRLDCLNTYLYLSKVRIYDFWNILLIPSLQMSYMRGFV